MPGATCYASSRRLPDPGRRSWWRERPLPTDARRRVPQRPASPSRRSAQRRRPVHRPASDVLQIAARMSRGTALPTRDGSRSARRVRIRIPREPDERRALFGPTLDPVEKVWRRPVDLTLGAELDGGATEVKVAVEDDDVLRARPIRLADHGARDLGMLDQAHDDDVLAGLHIGADANSELRVAAKRSRGSRPRRYRTRSVAPVEVARTARPEGLVQRGALGVLDVVTSPRSLRRAREAGGAQVGGRLAVDRLLDPGLFLTLEERVVLQRIAVEIAVEGMSRRGPRCASRARDAPESPGRRRFEVVVRSSSPDIGVPLRRRMLAQDPVACTWSSLSSTAPSGCRCATISRCQSPP